MTKYNPGIHALVVRNLRQYWKDAGKNEDLTLTDEEVWAVFEDWYFIDEDDRTKYVAGLTDAQKAKGSVQ